MIILELQEKIKYDTEQLIKKRYESYKNGIIDFNYQKSDNSMFISENIKNSKESKFIVETLSSVYNNNLLADLPSEDIEKIKKINLKLRNVSSLSNSSTWFSKACENSLKILDNCSDNIINKILSSITIRFLEEFDYNRRPGVYISSSESIGKGKFQEYNPTEIIISIKSEENFLENNGIAEKHGLEDSDFIKIVMLHELSHSIQGLHGNHKSIINAGLESNQNMNYGNIKFKADRELLGVKSYYHNYSYTVMLESYADTRALLMFGVLNPEKFNSALDAQIEWREKTAKKGSHDTIEALKKLKEKYPNGIKDNISAEEIHNTARNIATLNSLAKTELFLKDNPLDTRKSLVLNNINLLSLSNVYENNNEEVFLKKILKLKENIIQEEGITDIVYEFSNYDKYTGQKLIRDRLGFVITDDIIFKEKMEYYLSIDNKDGVEFREMYTDATKKSNDKKLANDFLRYGKLPKIEELDLMFDTMKKEDLHGFSHNTFKAALTEILADSTIERLCSFIAGNSNDELEKEGLIKSIKSDMIFSTFRIENLIQEKASVIDKIKSFREDISVKNKLKTNKL